MPTDKLEQLSLKLQYVLGQKKVTLTELQSLIGLLNFAWQAIRPGRAFCRRLIDATMGVSQPHHFIRVTQSMKEDITMWFEFIDVLNGTSFFLDQRWSDSTFLELFTDAVGGFGMGTFFKGRWAWSAWPREWHSSGIVKDITFLELLPIVIAIKLWGPELRNKKVLFRSDNKAVVDIVNKQSCKSSQVMKLVRAMVLSCLSNNVLFKAQHIPGLKNDIADAISRFQWARFRRLAPMADPCPTPIPESLWQLLT